MTTRTACPPVFTVTFRKNVQPTPDRSIRSSTSACIWSIWLACRREPPRTPSDDRYTTRRTRPASASNTAAARSAEPSGQTTNAAPAPSAARRTACGSDTPPHATCTPVGRPAASGAWVSARTATPADTSKDTTCRPTLPVAPVTRIMPTDRLAALPHTSAIQPVRHPPIALRPLGNSPPRAPADLERADATCHFHPAERLAGHQRGIAGRFRALIRAGANGACHEPELLSATAASPHRGQPAPVLVWAQHPDAFG